MRLSDPWTNRQRSFFWQDPLSEQSQAAPVFREGSGESGGALPDPTAYGPSDFRLQDWVQVPDEAPTVLDVHGCVQGVLTRPNARLRGVVEAARGGRAAAAPLVAVHVRAGKG